jgi:rod shape determining protein RodA
MIRSLWLKLIAPIDGPLMAFTALLLLVALFAMVSASPERMTTQLVNLGVALVVMRVVAQIPPQRLMRLALPVYLVGILLPPSPCSATFRKARGAGSISGSCASSLPN